MPEVRRVSNNDGYIGGGGMGMSTGKDCPARSGIAVKVASYYLLNVKVEGYTDA